MKAPLRPFDYMSWAQNVPSGARYDLAASGISDAVLSLSDREPWSGALPIEVHCRQDVQAELVGEFTEAVANRYGVSAELVTPTMGASLAITHVLMALVRAGDHVIVERPAYEALHRVPEIFGASVSRLERKFDEGWSVVPDRLAKLLTPRTRAVILTNLHNPSGTLIDTETLHSVAELAERVGARVLVDEVYLDFCWDEDARPACLVAPNAVSWSSATKCFGFSSLRAGWIVTCDDETSRALAAAADYLHVVIPASTAKLGAAAIRGAKELTDRANDIARRGRDVVERWLETETRVSWLAPAAGLAGCIRLPDLLQDGPFCDHLRAEYDTQVVPGTFFEAPGHVRVSFGLEPEDLRQALARFSSALDDLAT